MTIQTPWQVINLREDNPEIYRLIELGWSLLPLHGVHAVHGDVPAFVCGCDLGSKCDQPGKKPYPRFKDCGTVTETKLTRWLETFGYGTSHRAFNWAALLGYSGLAVIDIDVKDGKRGDLVWDELRQRHGGHAATPTDFIKGRGRHLWFAAPAKGVLPPQTKMEIAPGIDLKHGNDNPNTYVVVPPSRHITGNPYRWEDNLAPWQTPLAPLPQWVIDLAWEYCRKQDEEKAEKQAKAAADARDSAAAAANAPRRYHSTGGTYAPGDYDIDERLERAARFASRYEPAMDGSGGSNVCIKLAGILTVGFDLPIPDALGVMEREWNLYCSPPWSTADLLHKLNDAATNPRGREVGYMLNRRPTWRDEPLAETGPTFAPTCTQPSVPSRFGCTCGGNVLGGLCCIDPDAPPAPQLPATDARPMPDLTAAEVELVSKALAESALAEAASRAAFASAPRVADPFRDETADVWRRLRLGLIKRGRKCGLCQLMVNGDTGRGMGLKFRCDCWGCELCHALKQIAWKRHIAGKIGACDRDELFIGNVAEVDWGRVRKKLNRDGADYRRIKPPGGEPFVVATAPFCGSIAVNPDDAIAGVFSAIDALPVGAEKPISGSRGWAMPERENKGYTKLAVFGSYFPEVELFLSKFAEVVDLKPIDPPAGYTSVTRRVVFRLRSKYRNVTTTALMNSLKAWAEFNAGLDAELWTLPASGSLEEFPPGYEGEDGCPLPPSSEATTELGKNGHHQATSFTIDLDALPC